MSTYKINIAGVERDLPICPINDEVNIAGFVMFSDVEVTVAASKALVEKCPEFDIIVTAESKGIPLAYEMARITGKNYIVARKSIKAYMLDPISVEVKSITTGSVQKLFLSQADCEMLNGKKVIIVDDVISTGESLLAIEKLLSETGCEIMAKACVLAEGDAIGREDIVYLEELPLFFN